ncbi:tannase/feruloyl esterase family alpha/beta hydrolase [Streptomyces fractus]|uniref:tannase/feruloyl esterase family alpha/beta hydrolase n=1 Tax=Streptomyces fractus TaxID=641806 RepID=UPI003CE71D57
MRSVIAAASALAVLTVPAAFSAPAVGATARAPEACAALAGSAIPAKSLGLPTSGGRVTGAKTVPASGTGSASIGEYCQVDAELLPVDPEAPSIQMRVALPAEWNRRAFMFGGGGYDGSIPPLTDNIPFGATDKATPLGRGFAVFASDSGHQNVPGDTNSGSFGVNDEAVRNFSGDALKKTRDAAMFLIAKHYGMRAEHSYFAGGSSGGREALAVAQRWPRDFDGVISVYPAGNAASLDLWFGYMAQVLQRPGAFPNTAKQQLVYDHVMQTCDGDDGVRDGIISDEAGCDFDPRVLRCPDGEDAGDQCLSDPQIKAIQDLSSPVDWGYKLGSGERGYPGLPYLSGANVATPVFSIGNKPPSQPVDILNSFGIHFWDQWVKYFVTRDPGYDSLKLDPRNPGKWKARISELAGMQDVNDSDLSAFAKAGGKLLLLHGTADPIASHRSTAQYYQRVRSTMGERATSKFLRMYTIPGAGHGGFTPFSPSWDSVTAVQRWSEEGRAPHNAVVSDTSTATAGRTRPLCSYPEWPKYDGSGDPDQAGSFTCVRS